MIETLALQPWVQRLGWVLIHFLWQGLSIAMLYAAARKNLARRASPNARYLLGCAALGAMMLAPIVTWGLMRVGDPVPDAAYRLRNSPPSDSAIAAVGTLQIDAPHVEPAQFLPWTVMVWLAGAIVFWVRLAGGWVVATRMRSMLVRRAPPEWQSILIALGTRIGVSRPVQLLVSALVPVPNVVGWLRPVVLVPVGAIGGLPAEHLEALLLHELAHIRRHDYLINMLQNIAEAMLFYHPAIWWVSAHIRSERELCCDDIAVSVSGDALRYAHALANLEACRPVHLNVAMAANGGALTERIGRLLGQSRPPARNGLGPGVLTLGILLVVAACGLFGQAGAAPAFQAASIKRNISATRMPMIVRPQAGGRLTAVNAPLMMLIQNAYEVQAFQVVGGPGWISTDGYDLEATPEGAIDRKQMWLMLQTLLADRFQLKLHRESRELPAYLLTTTKAGAKLPAPKEGACAQTPPQGPPQPGALPPCGNVVVALSQNALQLVGGKTTTTELTRVLSMVVGRPVLDRTEYSGTFDVHLEFTPSEATAGLPGSGGRGDPGGPQLSTDVSRPTIFAALQEQLGLRLAAGKGPVDVLVIDHVERPAAN
jgi:uncharacterized protein (TIGR03435 family)